MDNTEDIDLSSPGNILRYHREKAELSKEDVAKRLHLDIQIIEDIESNKFEHMSSPIYVRGYLRSYAKIVNAEAEQVIDLYNADSPPPPPEILPEVKPPTQASSNDKPVKAFTYLISLGLVLLLLIWYQSNFVVEPDKPDDDITDTQEELPKTINGVDTDYKIVTHPEGWSTTNELSTPESSSIEMSLDESLSEDSIIGIQTDENKLVESEPVIESISSETIETTLSPDSDSLILSLSQDSWIEVYDSEDERLFFDLGVSGQSYTIEGQAPFRIQLGFSNGVKLTFNGEPFDPSPYSKNGVANFTLPVE